MPRESAYFYRSCHPFASVAPRREAFAARFGQPRNSLRSNNRCCFSSASQRLPRLRTELPLRHCGSCCIECGLRGLAERNMDGAAGNPPRSAPHESRSPPTANLRSGRFVRARARWVAAGVPWSEARSRSHKVTGWRMCKFHSPQVGEADKIFRITNSEEQPIIR